MRSRWATRPALGGGAEEAAAAAVAAVTVSGRLVEGKGRTLARRHISASPRAQCMASQARQGTPSSVAMGFQSSGLSLRGVLVGLVRRIAGTASCLSFC